MVCEEFLLKVKKPAQYIGQEWNIIHKDFQTSLVRICLCFPDLYEVGMSNLGIRILYGLLNSYPDICCERLFLPEVDMQRLLKSNNYPLVSLESAKPLANFDIVGFSLSYELCYTNVLAILELSGIPLWQKDRKDNDPLVIAGGPCTLNPEPMADFFDIFVIGEAEEVILKLIETYKNLKSARLTRKELLISLANIPGVYVPSLYEVEYNQEGRVISFYPNVPSIACRIKKQFVLDLDKSFFPTDWLVPNISIVHDRVALEIMRGCPNHCCFCQARNYYYPLRIRKPDTVFSLAQQLISNTGYEELSLLGLSVSDYPYLNQVLVPLVEYARPYGVSISIPSVKPKTILSSSAELIATIKKTALTFAPEAATKRLRVVIGKEFDEEEFFSTVSAAYAAGYKHLKLYFMIGLPTETEEDRLAILEFCHQVAQIRQKKQGSPAQVNVSINTLIPKPHTPLQWTQVLSLSQINNYKAQLLKANKKRYIKITFHNAQMSILEAILSRGDRRLSDVIYLAFKKGCILDAWSEHFLFEKWQSAFKEANIDPEFYLKEIPTDALLPWDFIDTGVKKQILLEEFQRIQVIGQSKS
ncbi:MAG: TIGR03960 family B12-binding radical SAM protein [Candidatus Omnitrophica bacterium]|nr:TIGR03960 family B12-binding radical SAM protein [Candidatus Omnitrophota bacterium]